MMALANMAGGSGAYLALAGSRSVAEAAVHQAVAVRTLEMRREREKALNEQLAVHVANAVGRVMAKVFS